MHTKGGFNVDLSGEDAFLPGTQVDMPLVRDAGSLIGLKTSFKICKMDHRTSNIVVSRRAYLEELRAKKRAEIFCNLSEGQTVEGASKTSPNMVHSLTWVALTTCCMSPTWHCAVWATRPRS